MHQSQPPTRLDQALDDEFCYELIKKKLDSDHCDLLSLVLVCEILALATNK